MGTDLPRFVVVEGPDPTRFRSVDRKMIEHVVEHVSGKKHHVSADVLGVVNIMLRGPPIRGPRT